MVQTKMPEDFGLGRRPAPDPRDAAYPIRPLLAVPQVVLPNHRYWNANGWWGDQGGTSECVAYSWTHWLEDGPIGQTGVAPVVVPDYLYHEAQKVDEWDGEDYDGTSVRAGAKVLQAMGFIESYHWTTDIHELIATILALGPVVVGTNWYSQMFYPDSKGRIYVGGYVAGGHAYKLDGANIQTELVRIKNSWGRDWGRRGHAYISFNDLERLIKEDGEACLAVEVKRGA